MTSKKMFFVMIGLVGLCAVLIIAAAVGGDLLLQKQSQKLVGLKLDNQVLEGQQTALSQAKKDLEKYSELETIAKQVVPQDKDQARATREIITIAAASGIKISSIGFPASTLGQALPKAAADADASKTGSSSTTPTTPAAPAVSQVKPVSGIEGLYQLDITVTSDPTSPATYAKLIDFLKRLEQNRRTAQVTQISITPDSLNRTNLNFTLTITLYIKP